jgi:large subunit ribosomal protein L18
MAKTNPKVTARLKRIKRIRKNISGTGDCPRLRVFKSAKHIYGQIVDDVAGHTLVAASTLDKDLLGGEKTEGGKKAQAHKVGMLLAEKAKQQGIEKVVFDRGGFLYHGRVKSLSDGAREGGLQF